jgi:hypothetical protein
MAGSDYSGFAINFKTEQWTLMGYIRDGKKILSFDKIPDDNFQVLLAPSESNDSLPGIAIYNNWYCVFGYTNTDNYQWLKDYLTKHKKTRELSLFKRILEKKPVT